jgi:hypothetical protein
MGVRARMELAADSGTRADASMNHMKMTWLRLVAGSGGRFYPLARHRRSP